jgi:succinate dehydrogenase/fumarate reductase cytochrome b subunit
MLNICGFDAHDAMNVIGNCSLAGHAAKFAVAFPLSYHFAAGVRHLVWDQNPEPTLNNESVEKSSYAVIGGAAAVSVVIALL